MWSHPNRHPVWRRPGGALLPASFGTCSQGVLWFRLISIVLISSNSETCSCSSFYRTRTQFGPERCWCYLWKTWFSISFPFFLPDFCLTPAGDWQKIFKLYLWRWLHNSLMKIVTRAIWQTGTKVHWWPLGFLGQQLSHALSVEESRRVTW